MRHYVFGYGSLICAESRAITDSALGGSDSCDGEAIPVRLRNWVRLWNVRGPNTYLGVKSLPTENVEVANDNTEKNDENTNLPSCVGVLVPLPSKNENENEKNNKDDDYCNDEVLQALDRREMGYNRHRVDMSLIERVDDLLFTSIEDDDNDDSDDDDSDDNDYNGISNQQWRMQAIEDRYYKNTFLRRQAAAATTTTTSSPSNHDNDDAAAPAADDDAVCVWIYVPRERYTGMARVENPILQSYVDIALRGCLSISESFAREFVKGTYGWYPGHQYRHPDILPKGVGHDDDDGDGDDNNNSLSSCWVDDRKNPKYTRADKEFSIDNSEILDACLILLVRRRKTYVAVPSN